MKPPYGVLSAINLERGELMFQVPHGDTPDAIRQHPKLQGMNIPKTGQAAQRRPDGDEDARDLGRSASDRASRTAARRDAARVQYKQTGAQVGEVWMPARRAARR
jgi:quinoprotein glucose dehydrogenase